MDKIKEVIAGFIFWVYSKIFGGTPGTRAKNFLKDLTFVFTALSLSKFFSVFIQVYIGRSLGADEYGKFALIISVSHLLYVPMLFGIGTAMVRYLAPEENDIERKKIFSSGIFSILLFTSFFSIIFYSTAGFFANLISISPRYFHAAIVMAIAYTFWVLSQKISQGLNEMRKLSAINVLWGISTAIFVVIFIDHFQGARPPVYAFIIGYVLSASIIIPEFRKNLIISFSRDYVKSLLRFSSFIVLGIFSVSVTENINKILINFFMSLEDVGIYQAYYFSTFSLVGFFVTTISMVFFPEASRHHDKKEFFLKVKMFLLKSPALFPALLLISFVILKLYGPGYPLKFLLLILFVYGSLQFFVYSLLTWFAVSIGENGAKIFTMTILIISTIMIILSFYLVQHFGIYGAVISLIFSYLIGTIFLFKKIKEELFRE